MRSEGHPFYYNFLTLRGYFRPALTLTNLMCTEDLGPLLSSHFFSTPGGLCFYDIRTGTERRRCFPSAPNSMSFIA